MTPSRRVAVTLYAYAFLDDLVLLYPVYALLFSETGLSVWQISTLFAVWSASSLILEVPSGALADVVSRRLLLWIGPLLTAAGFGLWVAAPSYWAFALGFVLWGAKGALTSGALEALVYEELDRAGAAGRYAQIMGRAKAAGTVGVVLAIAIASPVLAAGGYPAVGAASVVACLVTAAVAATFPEHRDCRTGADEDDELGWAATLRAGLGEARHHRPVRTALILVVLVTAVWGSLDEYTPLLISSTGVADATVPLLLLLIWAAVAVGGLATGPAERLRTPWFAVLLVLAAAAMAAGALSGHPGGIVLVALAFGAFQAADVVVGARLQQAVTGPARATVTSVAGMVTDLATIGVFGLYAALTGLSGHGGAFALLAIPYAGVALWLLGSRMPDRRPG
ncbi:MFS transporter [Actinoplanes friuliensis]|uniref:Major facilitator transporter n=1 Tax=Actinoplanes friuliensis DSM 7358 TaxID=1246995 RepID=U5VXA8_9ACTN|nr:MFS transporter [Actinoplanes friuliensis]AGZ41588.1 major facilitator transporter [Actinoplanes friuliensis DSM 7358]